MTGAHYDVVVVGAGPAGSITALELARRGHSVALVDRHTFPRPKACGDCLSPEAARVLDRLGLLDAIAALAPARLDGWCIRAPDGRGFSGTFERAAAGDVRVTHALALPRERLDAALVDAACGAGVELLAPLRVDALLRDRGIVNGVIARDADAGACEIRARLVVGADGLRSVVARRARATAAPGGLRKLSFTLHPRLSADFTDGRGEMHVIPGGCIGIAPVEAGAAPLLEHNVTFVTTSRARRGDARATMRRMAHAAPGLATRLPELLAAIDAAGRPLASGPFDRPARFATADGLALVGDAAGYYDPFTGQGVYQALTGGERLARVADAALRETQESVTREQLRPYADWLARSRRPARAVQRVIEYVTARERLMNRCARAIERAPRFADALVAVTGDLAPIRTLGGAAVVSLGSALVTTRAGSRP